MSLWILFSRIFISTSFPWPSQIKVMIIRLFGARVGKHTHLQPRVDIHFPWKLILGDFVWIGKNSFLHNMEVLEICSNTAIGHNVMITTGSHDFLRSDFSYRNKPSKICSFVWVTSNCFIGPGVTVAEGCILYPGCVVTRNTQAWFIYHGNPSVKLRQRKLLNL